MRKTSTVTIDTEGRDKGKAFFITEMSAAQAERWAARVLFALGKAGVQLPAGVAGAGVEGLAAIGFMAVLQMDYRDAEPLLDEMMGCIQIIPDPTRPEVKRNLIDDDIEEVANRLKLRMEVFSLHVGFSIAASLSTLTQGSAAPSGGSRTTRTSRRSRAR